MNTKTSEERTYALGHSKQELERLSRQGRAFAPFTRQLLIEAGITPGMRVLDIGCGSGDVAFLAADIVGTSGEVAGVDRAAAAVEWAKARASAPGAYNVSFLVGDPTCMEFPHEFDAIVGRLVLMYYPDPVHALANLIRHLRPAGVTIFQEFDIANCRSHPCSPLFDRSVDLIKRTLSATGARTQLGLELYAVFADAGLPGPSMRMDSLIGGGRDIIAYELVTEVIQTLLPVMEKLGIATSDEIDVATLPRRMSEEVVSLKGVVLSPGLIGAWSRKPAQFTAPVVNA